MCIYWSCRPCFHLRGRQVAGRQFLLSGEVLLLIFLANKVVLAVGRKHHLLPGMGSALLCNFLPFIGVVRTFLSSPLLRTFYLYFYSLLPGRWKWKKREIHFNENKVAASLFYSQFVNYKHLMAKVWIFRPRLGLHEFAIY